MISVTDLAQIASARLEDAKILLAAGRFDGAVYLCGYGVEIALKARICKTLNWAEFPDTRGEFRNLESFRTHDLDASLRLSGLEPAMAKPRSKCGLELEEEQPRFTGFKLEHPDRFAHREGRVIDIPVDSEQVVTGMVPQTESEARRAGHDLAFRICTT